MNSQEEYQSETMHASGVGAQQPVHYPARAALLALIPGIGAVYNREYSKAVAHFAVFAGLVYIADSVGVFGLAAFVFFIYTVIDAYRSAEAIALRMRKYPSGHPSEEEPVNLPLWGTILILMGGAFLLDNLGAIRLRSMVEYWPIGFIALGAYMVYTSIGKAKGGRGRGAAPGMPPPVSPVASVPQSKETS